jgi:YD repeat-containing protein
MRTVVTILMALVVASAPLGIAQSVPPSNFSFFSQILIDHRRVPNTDQTDFPVLISGVFPFLANSANGGQVQNSSGYDIVFTSDAAGQVQLDHEVDSYDPNTGTVNLWVRIPTLSHTTDTSIYMWYGSTAVQASQENKAGVWRNGYAGVWHFGGSTLGTNDSTANANNAINHGVTGAAGKFGQAGSFNGSNTTYLDIPSSNSYKPATNLTLEAWVFLNNVTQQGSTKIISLDYNATGTWSSPYQAYGMDYFHQTGAPRIALGAADGAVSTEVSPKGQWIHIVGTYDGNNLLTYQNGTRFGSAPQTGNIAYGTSKDLAIGNASPYVSVTSELNGLIDEVRISTVTRSADWIAAEYNNQNSPSTFFAVCPSTVSGNTPTPCFGQVAPSNLSFVREILIDHRQVANTDQTDFPVLISGTFPYLANVAHGGKVQNISGYDVLFTSDAAGQDQLDHEIDSYNPTTGAAGFWVRIPTLSHTTDTPIYMWYGNSVVQLSQENPAGVWRSGYAGVWHFGGSTLGTKDSTANANNALNIGVTSAVGKFGTAGSFNGSNSTYLQIPSSSSFKPATNLTVEAWVFLNNQTQPSYPKIVSLDYNATGSWSSPYQAYGIDFYSNTTQPQIQLLGGTNPNAISPQALPMAQWGHIAGTYDGSNMIIYANGARMNSASLPGPIAYGTSKDLAIGIESPYAPGSNLNGLIDEVRVSTVTRSADWIATEFNNQNSTATFFGTCDEAPTGGTLPSCSLLLPPNSYSFFREIIIDHRQSPNTDQTDFPFLVSTTLGDLASVGNGGYVQNVNGYDIVFTSDAAGQNQLDHEIDSYNPSTGAVAFWVRIPTLSHVNDTPIYMWYGNSAVQVSQENKAGVWRNGYAAVWHFGVNGLSTADSTANQNNAINRGATNAAGRFGGQAASFNGSNTSFIDVPSSSSYKPSTNLTLEAWVYLNNVGQNSYPKIISLDYNANGSWSNPYQAYGIDFYSGSTQPQIQLLGGSSPNAISPQALPKAQWGHIVGTYDGSSMAIYANGARMNSASLPGPIAYGTSKDLAIGMESPYAPGSGINGLIDEVRISTVTRSADWITTEFNNQNSPSTNTLICASTPVGSPPPQCIVLVPISSFSFFRQIVIDHRQVVNTDQTDFPFLLSVSLPDLATAANGGHLQNSNGYDIVFTSDAAGQSRLDYEIDSYNPVTGAAAFWIRIPTLSHTTDSTIYMWYGSNVVGASQENKPGVWRNGYAGVWHLGGTQFTAFDSAGSNNGLLSNATANVPGIFGGAVSFSGTANSYISVPGNSQIKPSSALTLEAWVNPSQPTGANQVFSLDYRADGTWNSPWTSYALSAGASQIEFSVTGANGSLVRVDGSKTAQTASWSHVAGTYDGNTLHLFENGVADSAIASTQGAISYGASRDLTIGSNAKYQSSNVRGFTGTVDELRISSVARSADWIATEYNNQALPSSSVVVCPATAAGGQPPSCSVSGLAIFAVSPSSAPIGKAVSISGTGFGSIPGSVAFNGVGAIINGWSNVAISTTVPAAATTGPLSVTTSSQASVQTAFTVTSAQNLTTTDIGNVSGAASVSLSNGLYTVTTHGSDIGGTVDTATFLYQQWSGDFDVLVRVTSQQSSGPLAKAGLMVRETLDPAARNMFAFLTPTQGSSTAWRLTPGTTEVNGPVNSTAQPSYWLRLMRRGNNFAALSSPDGQQWFALGSQMISMTNSVYVGIGQTSNGASSNTATYDHYSAASSALPLWLEQDLGSPSSPGVSIFDGTSFFIHATGADLANALDAAHFLYQAWTGDFDMKVHLLYQQNSSAGAKVGIMAREAGTDAANAAVWFTPPGADGASWRTSTGANTGGASAPTSLRAPGWIRMIRRGNNFSAYFSADGASWQLQAAKTVNMGAGIYVGAFATTLNGIPSASVIDTLQIVVPTAPAGLQSPWSEADIGSVYSAGNSSFDGLSTVVLSGGYDVWNAPDAFHFVYQALSTDFDAVARFTYIENTDQNAKVGLLVRQSLDPSAGYFGTEDRPVGAIPQWRYVGQTSSSNANSVAANVVRPYWLRLVRSGTTFWSYGSADGVTWALLEKQNMGLTSPVYMGVSTSPHVSTPGNAVFDSLSVRSTTLAGVPKVLSINPTTAGPQAQLTIQGGGFGNTAGTVQINGIASVVTGWNDSTITITSPSPAPAGPVLVVAADGTQSNSDVMFTGINPTIAAVSPSAGLPGDKITISGSGFGAQQAVLTLNGAAVSPLAWQDNQIIAYVSPGAQTGPVVVTQSGVGSNNNIVFTVLSGQGSGVAYGYDPLGRLTSVVDTSTNSGAIYNYDAVGNIVSIQRTATTSPVSIVSFNPPSGVPSSVVRIVGTNFSSTASLNSVSFNGTIATVYRSTPTTLVVGVPSGATSGSITVASPGGTATSSGTFTVKNAVSPPVILSFSPAIADQGAIITVTGTNFDPVAVNNQITFGGVQLTPTTASATSLTFVAPGGMRAATINLQTAAGAATSLGNLFIVPPDFRAANVSYASKVLPTSTTTVPIPVSNHVGLLFFDDFGGHSLFANMQSADFTPRSASILLYAYGDTLLASTFDPSLTAVLPATGTYAVIVSPQWTAGTATVQLFDAVNLGGTVPADGTSFTITTTTPGQSGTFKFGLPLFSHLYWNETATTYAGCNMTINGPDGSLKASMSCGAPSSLDLGEIQEGPYSISIVPVGASTGSVTMNLTDIADVRANATINGGAVVLTTTVPKQYGYALFSGTASQSVTLQITSSIQGVNTSFGVQRLSDLTNVYSASVGSGATVSHTVTLPSTDMYRVWVGPGGTATGALSVTITSP